MSSYTDRNWLYRVTGKNIYLYVKKEFPEGNPDQLGRFSSSGDALIYPDETIVNGLMFEGTSLIEPFIDDDPNALDNNANPGLELTGSVDETKHINLTRVLSLAVVDYIKAMTLDSLGDIEKKEYYMKQFWKKVGDSVSNRHKVLVSSPFSPFAIR